MIKHNVVSPLYLANAINWKTGYLVKLEDKTSWKTVKVVDGEMEVSEEFLKE